jgi:putative PIG3 family NAD(P)H quinone oxidoreductase
VRAIVDVGGRLQVVEVAAPKVGFGEIEISVAAAGVNRADLLQRAGHYPPPPGASEILGLEVSGRVAAVGDGVTGFAVGDSVCALLSGGGYAERVVVPAGQVLPVPDGVGLVEAAGLPEVFATAFLNIFIEGAATPGERVLVHAGGSGVGTAAIQLCRAFGCPVWVTVGTADKLRRCVALGATGGAVRGASPGWMDLTNSWTDARGFDVILDPVAGSTLDGSLGALAVGGRLVVIGMMGGRTAQIDIAPLMARRLTVRGSVLRSRSVGEKAEIVARLHRAVWPLLSRSAVRPVIDGVFAADDADAAHQLMASNRSFGKILIAFADCC